jgi:putative transposase
LARSAARRDFRGDVLRLAQEIRQLKDENARLKRIVTDLSLDKEMLQDVIRARVC